jgi:hypothetical protein
LDREESKSIPGDKLKVALDGVLKIFGEPGRQYILEDLQSHGIVLEEQHAYKLEQVKSALSIIGGDSATLIVERLRKSPANAR